MARTEKSQGYTRDETVRLCDLYRRQGYTISDFAPFVKDFPGRDAKSLQMKCRNIGLTALTATDPKRSEKLEKIVSDVRKRFAEVFMDFSLVEGGIGKEKTTYWRKQNSHASTKENESGR